MTSKNCLGLLLHCFAAASALVSAAAQAQSGITQYTAEYQAEYKGRVAPPEQVKGIFGNLAQFEAAAGGGG